jgi:hypothetical protein
MLASARQANNTVNKYKDLGLETISFDEKNKSNLLPPLTNRAQSINRNFDLDLIRGDADKYSNRRNENRKKSVA